jgi:hypothetical protein
MSYPQRCDARGTPVADRESATRELWVHGIPPVPAQPRAQDLIAQIIERVERGSTAKEPEV